MIVRHAYFACWRYWRIGGSGPKPWDDDAHASGDITAGMAAHMPEEEVAHTIAAKARAGL